MKLVVDANVVVSALIADSKTRQLIVTLEPNLLTPEFVHDEIEHYEGLIVEKSGMTLERVTQFVDLLFQYIACALASDSDIWSDDSDFEEQNIIEAYTTSGVIDSFDTL